MNRDVVINKTGLVHGKLKHQKVFSFFLLLLQVLNGLYTLDIWVSLSFNYFHCGGSLKILCLTLYALNRN